MSHEILAIVKSHILLSAWFPNVILPSRIVKQALMRTNENVDNDSSHLQLDTFMYLIDLKNTTLELATRLLWDKIA